MRSRKRLKKEINKVFNELYSEVMLYEAFSANADENAARALVDKMIDTEEELIKRTSVNEGKEATGRVKMYFQKLINDFKIKVEEIKKEIVALP